MIEESGIAGSVQRPNRGIVTGVKNYIRQHAEWLVPRTFEEYLAYLNPSSSPDPNDFFGGSAMYGRERETDCQFGRRKDLLQKGLVFSNLLGGGEKFILDTEVVIDRQKVNLGNFTLLTQERVEAALALDRDELSVIAPGVTPHDIARHMLRFLHEPRYNYLWRMKQLIEKNPTFLARPRSLEAHLEAEWKSGAIPHVPRPLHEFFASRGLEKTDFLCPFLTCGHRIQENIDLTFWKDDKSREVEDHIHGLTRLSTVTAHLASHGLSERGGASDQRYMTMAEYYQAMMQQVSNV